MKPTTQIRKFQFTRRQKLIAQLNGLRTEFMILLESVRVNAILNKEGAIPPDHFARLCHVLSNSLIIELVKFDELYTKEGLQQEIATWHKGRKGAINVYMRNINEHNWQALRHNTLAHPHSNRKGEFIHRDDIRKEFDLPNLLGDLVVPGWCVCRIAERMASLFPEDNEEVSQTTRTKTSHGFIGRYKMASDIDAASDAIEREAEEAERSGGKE